MKLGFTIGVTHRRSSPTRSNCHDLQALPEPITIPRSELNWTKTNLGEPCLKPADIDKGFAFYPIYFKLAERFSPGTRGRAK